MTIQTTSQNNNVEYVCKDSESVSSQTPAYINNNKVDAEQCIPGDSYSEAGEDMRVNSLKGDEDHG